ncbi:uncharacterized protein LOC111911380 [Lactuca sativa]|uniref:uncharacterized protein LOC111911380 n=1 Tax=Lactuca sativa TaxID=4236 RepID=UPI0022AFD801|nr:uncharacterized protein LOC111911380 [Lactuca sativa]
MGDVDSFHNKAREKCEFLMREKQAINVVLRRQTELENHKYKARLHVSIIVVRLLLKIGLPFGGHDESVNLENRGLYIEVLKAIRETSEYIFNNTLESAPKNNQLISPKIQKELVQFFAQEVLLSTREDIGQDVFALLVDESSDVSKKEQMAIVLGYVDSLGFVKEIFIGLVHVKDTSSLTLKNAINEVLTSNKLSFSKLFADVLVVLDFVKEEGGSLANRQQVSGILTYFQSYEFVFYLHMMYDILHLTGTLSKQLQRKDLDILEAASMVRGTMEAFQSFRNTGFAIILPKVSSFCQTHKIDTLDMEEL